MKGDKRVGWLNKKIEKFRRLPRRYMFLHVLGKFVFGIGLGALLVIYIPQLDWRLLGWILIALSIIIAIPSAKKMLSRE